jgi:hypothetical protein
MDSMRDADHLFSHSSKRQSHAAPTETRLIVRAPRRGGLGTGQSRVVEVVHLRSSHARPRQADAGPDLRHAHAETWPEGFRAKPVPPPLPQDITPAAPTSQPPVGHVLTRWTPTPPLVAQPAAEPVAPAPKPVVVRSRQPRAALRSPAPATQRRFADPFARHDGGTNCLRCGYLVEPARAKRDLWICAGCS